MDNFQPYVGNYEDIIGRSIFVKVRGRYISGRVSNYSLCSHKFGVMCEDGKYRRIETVYIRK